MKSRRSLPVLAFVSLGLGLAASSGCGAPNPDAETTQPDLPTMQSFPWVEELLEYHCGSIDCHGSIYRNLRVYGFDGLRASSKDRPCYPAKTTTRELELTYDSVVGLQPEVMNQVVADHGADPQRLDLLAKPMGLDQHMGGTVITQGDPKYQCIASWLAGATDTSACMNGVPGFLCRQQVGSTLATP